VPGAAPRALRPASLGLSRARVHAARGGSATKVFSVSPGVPIRGMVVEKRPWPDFEISPWAGEQERPTVLEVARVYPGHALGAAIPAFSFGIFPTAIVGWGLGRITHAVLGVGLFTSIKPAIALWLVVSAGVWWIAVYALIRGWWRHDNSG
jgi:hypothetical protein